MPLFLGRGVAEAGPEALQVVVAGVEPEGTGIQVFHLHIADQGADHVGGHVTQRIGHLC